MKAQKLGLVLGMNMAVACMVMQGCKATKPGDAAPVAEPTVVAAEPTAKSDTNKVFAKRGARANGRTLAPSTPATSADPVVAPVEPSTSADPTIAVTTPKTSTTTVEPVAAKPTPTTTTKVTSVKPLPPPGKPGVKTAAAKPAIPAAGTPSATAATTYVVKSGETVLGICNRQKVSYTSLLAANPGINPDKIRVGQKLNLPVDATATAAAPTTLVKAKATTAKTGKTMQAAATVPTATAANTKAPITKKSAYVPYTGATKKYTVKNGDTLGQIAKDCGITMRALKELNGLTKDSLRIGQELQIPAEKVMKAAAATTTTAKTNAKEPAKTDAKATAKADAKDAAKAADKTEVKPTAAKGEAKAENKAEAVKPAAPAAATNVTTVAEAKSTDAAAKPAVPEQIAPAAAEEYTTYTVKEGEDVIAVAIYFKLSPSKLMSINDLKPGDTIKPGQVLKIPASAKPDSGL